MPSACSEVRCRLKPDWPTPSLTVLLAGLPAWLPPIGPLLAILLLPAPVRAENPWLNGHFPVPVFLGYTSHYGRRHGPSGALESHHGLDIAAPLGSPVHSWWGGRVTRVIDDQACGLGLELRSGPWEHLYCHLAGSVRNGVYRADGVQLAPGQPVRRGQLIGRIGISGRSTGPHLHWGLRYGGQWLDPARILRAMAEARRRGAPNARPEPRVGLFR